jgi:hypothetical protein
MTIVTGRVVNGHIEVDDFELPEGAEVTVLYGSDGPPLELTPELEAELDESIAEIERGEWVDGDDFLRELRRRRSSS